MMKKTNNPSARPIRRRVAFGPQDHNGVPDKEPSFWGGDWAARFATNFTERPEKIDPRVDEIADAVNRVIKMLPEAERRIVVDYHLLCLSRKTIADRQNIDEREVDTIRTRAERRLRGMLAGFVEQRFGLTTAIDSVCPYCRAPNREEIDGALSRRNPREAWGALRRRINGQFGLDIKRVQTLMTHCRFHGLGAMLNLPPAQQEQSHV